MKNWFIRAFNLCKHEYDVLATYTHQRIKINGIETNEKKVALFCPKCEKEEDMIESEYEIIALRQKNIKKSKERYLEKLKKERNLYD